MLLEKDIDVTRDVLWLFCLVLVTVSFFKQLTV